MLEKFKEKICNHLLFLSNNENIKKSIWQEQEKIFDIGFVIALFISMFLALLCWISAVIMQFIGLFTGNHILMEAGKILTESGWIFIAVIFFIECFDSVRHNRPFNE